MADRRTGRMSQGAASPRRPRSQGLEALIIRPAALDEQRRLEALQRRASLMWEEDRQALLAHPDAIELPIDQIADGRVWVAEQRGAVVGFSVLLPGNDGAIELDGLFVEPDFRGKGIGRQLVAHAVAMARDAGAGSLRVVANPRAAGFYAACGFEIIGEEQTRFGRALSAVLEIDCDTGPTGRSARQPDGSARTLKE